MGNYEEERLAWGLTSFYIEQRLEDVMKKLNAVAALLLLPLLWGCREQVFFVDVDPPASPRGLYSIAGDNVMEVGWIHNTERDLAGYNVFVSTSPNGRFEYIGTTAADYFLDWGACNGTTYYYAVSAFDRDGNESPLSSELAYDTPRPEGTNVGLRNYLVDPDHSGYDFSTYTTGPYDDDYSDIFFEYYRGVYYMDVFEDTDIQDMGYTNSLDAIAEAPEYGWSPTKDVQLIVGHTYVVWTWDNHFAKFRMNSLNPLKVDFDWAYQLQTGNPRLKRSVPAEREKKVFGEGFEERSDG
jgi:hypothetical protein